MKLFSLFTSANRSANRRNRLAVRAKRPNLLSQSDFFEGLEKRQLLATFNYNSGTGLLTVVTNQNSETLSIVSTSNAGNYTITTTGTWSGTSSSAVGNVSKNLFVNSTANINLIQISSNAANSGSAFYFGSSTGNFVDNLTVNFTNSTSGAITVANRTSFINGSNLNLSTAGNQITVSNLTSANSTGSIRLTGRNIVVTGNITTEAGDISLTGNNGTYRTGTFDGVRISGAAVNVNTTSGNITIDGRGGLNSVNAGVNLTSSKVQADGSGGVTITGVSGNGSTNNAYGILANGVTVTTNSGSLTVNGTSCGTGTSSCGVYLLSSSTISATGSGNVTITGKAANGTDFAFGVIATRTNVTTSSGSITVNGTSCGTGMASEGVHLSNFAKISATDAGNVTITGTAANGTLFASGINVSGSNVTTSSGSIMVNGTSCGTGSQSYGVFLNSYSIISATGTGNVTITGSAANGTNRAIGIHKNGSTVTTSSGSLTVNGTSCGTGYGSIGVNLQSNSKISATGAGNVTITGIAANGTDTACGISTGISTVTTSSGSLTINGTSCGTGGGSTGVYLVSSANISATGSGNVTITGTAAHGIDNACGIFVLTSTVTTSSGSLTVNGTACGTGQFSSGVYLGSSNISATGAGHVTITGIAANGTTDACGIFVYSSNVTTNSGSLTVNGTSCGTGTSSTGVSLFASATISATGAGNVTITGSTPANLSTGVGINSYDAGSKVYANGGLINLSANSMNLTGTVNATTAGNVLIQTFGVGVNLGGADSSANLGLTSTEINQITAATIQIGSTASGNVTVSSNVTIPVGSNLTLVSNNAPSTGILSYGTLTMGAGKVLDISALPSVKTQINGTTAQRQYSQLNVVGNLSIAGRSLNLSGSYTPVDGDVFLVASATSLTGTFTGLADGSTITLNGSNLTVNYSPTAVTLTAPSSSSAPSINTQPTSQTATAGATATFTAAASGTPTPTVKWQSNSGSGWSDIPLATSNSYTTGTLTSVDNGTQYRAIYTNGVGTDATTNAATLTVNFAPSISSQPTNQTVNSGQSATFTAAATGNPTPTVQWQVNDGLGWVNVTTGTGGTTNSYTTAALTSTNNGYQYRALYSNSVTANVATSAATVSVNFAPSISSQPTNQTVNSGQTATFTAAATGNPTPTVQWQVSSDGTNWSNVSTGTGGTTNSYTTAALTSTNNGYQYRALYSNSVTANVATSAATVTVNASTSAPVITLQPVNTGVEAGQTATFTASATGNPAPMVQWQSSTDGSTGWADIGGATSPTLSFTASVGDNGKYYRAVFSNTVSPDATTNSARLAIGVAPIIITVNEMTIPVGMTSGMTVIATGSPAPTYSIATGALPAGVTLDSTTGLFMGTPAAGTAGNWPVTIKAENGIGAGATQAFSLKVTSTITSFTVSKGVAQRSYVRYLDLGMDSNASALALLNNPSRVQLTKADLNGVGSAPVSLSGFLSVPAGQSTLAVNFGTIGLGNSRNTSTADGYYTLGVDLDGNGTFETNLFFFRLFGDTNGDKEVTLAEQNAVLAGCSQAYNINLDLNGDGVVNTSDFQYVKKSVGKKLKSTLIVTS